MATAGAAVDYHEPIYTEMDTETTRRQKADRVLALEVVRLKQQVSDMQGALAKLTDTTARALNLARYYAMEAAHVEALLAETASRVQVVEEALGWDAHDGRTMYDELAAPDMPLVDAA